MGKPALLRWVSLAVVLWGAGPAIGGFSGLVLFGDSLTDVGNVYSQTFGISPQSPPYFNGRYSNGPLWAEHLAAHLNLPVPVPSRQGGRDYAYGGTKTGGGSSFYFPFSFPNLGSQINNYLGSNTPTAQQLFVVWGGGNDFIDGQSNPSVPVNNIAGHVTALANAGARQFLVPNLPPLGQVPRFRGTASEAVMDARSAQFNDLLATALDGLKQTLNVSIFQLDVEGMFHEMLQNPAQFGFTNITGTALVGSTPVPNPDEYLFWDDIHPTRVGHQLVGGRAAELVVTHKWISTQTGGSWTNPANWDPQGVPDSDWIAHLINDNIPLPQAAAMDQDSAVQHVLVRGDTNRMTLIVQNGFKLSAGSVSIAQQGEINLQGGTLSSAAVHVGAGATLGGTGDIDGAVTNSGIIAPGQPGTLLRINGEYTQTAGGTLQIELAGTIASNVDRLQVQGPVTLEGLLEVYAVDGFVPLPSQTFTVLSYASRQGELQVLNETGFEGLWFNPQYGATSLTLQADALGGDANLDGVVNLSDFNTLATNFGQLGRTWLQADFNGDGVVNLSDFNILAANFGLSAGLGGPTPEDWASLSVAVPEPSGAGALVGVLLALLSRRRRSPKLP